MVYNTYDDINFTLNIKLVAPTKITGLAILFYDPYEKRVAIIDLRDKILESSGAATSFGIHGVIKNVNLVSNQYNIGLFMNSELYSGDALNLLQIELTEDHTQKAFHKYPSSARGSVVLDYQFKIN